MDAEVNLSHVTVIVQDANAVDSSPFVDVEVVDNLVLAANESRIVRRCERTLRSF